MFSRNLSFQKSIDILISVFPAIVLTFMLNLVADTSFAQSMGWIGVLVLLPLKICLYTGIYVRLLEIVSREVIVFSFSRIFKKINFYWPVYTILLLAPFILSFVLFLFFPASGKFFTPILVSHLNIVVLFGFVIVIFNKKYLTPLKINKRSIPINQGDILTILGFYMLEQIFFYCPYFLSTKGIYWSNIFGFFREVMQYAQFIYVAVLVCRTYPEVEKQFENNKEIYLVSPVNAGIRDSFGSLLYRPYPPAFVVLKALTSKDYTFREFNKVFWHDRYFKGDRLVAITCFTGNSFEAYRIAKGFKKAGATVIMGGPHVTYLPDEALEYCDSVVIGEAEGVWKEVMADYQSGTLKEKYKGTAIDTYHEEVHQELLRSSPEVIRDFLETTRGCKFKCNFCTIPGLSSGRTRVKPTFQLVELIEKIRHKYKSLYFIDNNIYSDPRYAKELFHALKPLGIKWRTACTIDLAKNDEMLKLAQESGCELLLFGYEIYGSSDEKSQRGKFGLADKYVDFTKRVNDMGIRIKGSFVYGWDSDRFKDLWTLWRFCWTIKPEMAVINLLTPIPGSHTYDDMISKNCITNLNWRNYSFHNFVFKHPHINTKLVDLIFPIFRPLVTLTTSRVGFIAMAMLVLVVVSIFIFKL